MLRKRYMKNKHSNEMLKRENPCFWWRGFFYNKKVYCDGKWYDSSQYKKKESSHIFEFADVGGCNVREDFQHVFYTLFHGDGGTKSELADFLVGHLVVPFVFILPGLGFRDRSL